MIEPAGQLVTVFGGGGFIGRYVCEMLLKSAVRVRVAAREPRTAHFIARPDDGAMFGWGEDEVPSITDADRAGMVEAEALTTRIVTPAYAALDDDQAAALLAGLDAMEGALAA